MFNVNLVSLAKSLAFTFHLWLDRILGKLKLAEAPQDVWSVCGPSFWVNLSSKNQISFKCSSILRKIYLFWTVVSVTYIRTVIVCARLTINPRNRCTSNSCPSGHYSKLFWRENRFSRFRPLLKKQEWDIAKSVGSFRVYLWLKYTIGLRICEGPGFETNSLFLKFCGNLYFLLKIKHWSMTDLVAESIIESLCAVIKWRIYLTWCFYNIIDYRLFYNIATMADPHHSWQFSGLHQTLCLFTIKRKRTGPFNALNDNVFVVEL